MRNWGRILWRVLRRRPAARPRPTRRPALERLEDRAVPAVGFRQVNLVADRHHHALFTDPNLVNAWGITASPTGPFWVNDNGTGVATLYDGAGMAQPPGTPLVVTIPLPPGQSGNAAPTGIVFNGNSSDFIVSGSSMSGHAVFLFATEDGTISGWNPAADPTHAILEVNNSPAAVYKGLALASTGSGDFLFAANFRAGTVDEFDSSFHLVRSFTDPSLTAHRFAPFGIAELNGQLFVTFAKQKKSKHDDLAGPGNGFVDVFDNSGNFVKRLVSRGKLDSPWGLALAPSGFSKFGGDLLVGNFGDGHIHAYDPVSGQFRGELVRRRGHPLLIDGLWGLRFGNNGQAGSSGTLFFTAGPAGESHGLFGALIPR
jgi:uncharacterized protein (TIGR03118 family)